MEHLKKSIILTANKLKRAPYDSTWVTLFLILCFLPIVLILFLDQQSLFMSWNQGRGGFLFALVLLTAEYFIEKNDLKPKTDKRKVILLATSLVGISVYFTLTAFSGLHQHLLSLAQLFGVTSWNYSWVWAWDYVVFALYLTVVLVLCWGIVGLKRMATAVIYSFGMVIILLLDAVFPYDSLGPLQFVVPSMLYIDLALLRLIGVGAAYSYPNFLTLPTRRGPFSLAVYWPSAGVHSMIIYSLIMLAFLIKIPLSTTQKPLKSSEGILTLRFWVKEKFKGVFWMVPQNKMRIIYSTIGAVGTFFVNILRIIQQNKMRIIYFAIGAIGTFFVNVLRIFLLSSYVVFVSSEVAKFEEFHATIGEIMFLPWVAGYILLVTWLASRKKG